jgi:hypothetical protein
MANESTGENVAADRGPGWFGAVLETGLILLVFAAFGAWPVPDVNETVYLTKARHHADPSWGHGDWFLGTTDAHGAFYLLFGPIAAALPLEQAAWVGRWLGWLALAVGFRAAVAPLLTTVWSRILAAPLFTLALGGTTMAAEWVIGGCEAKVFSWGLLLGAVGAWFRGRWPWAWLLAGAATALHPVVGGWGAIAMLGMTGAARLGLIRDAAVGPAGPAQPRRAWIWLLPVAAVALAAWGIVPAISLTTGVDAESRALADRIYVVERLPHHLLPRTFTEPFVSRHLLAVLVWLLLLPATPATAAWGRCRGLVAVALGISLAGWLIAALEPWAPDLTWRLLRFYWFRLADGLVPLGLAAAAAALLADTAACRRCLPGRVTAIRAVAILGLAIHLVLQSVHWPLPGRTGLLPRSDAKVQGAAWADICRWVRDETPADACFITPRGAASFTWRTGRREVVCWKNSPQDAASLVEWRKRIMDCFSIDGRSIVDLERSTAVIGAERMRQLAETYGADHAIVPLDLRCVADLPFERLHANDAFAVYRLVPP